jgi:hypothetical protein
MSSLEMRLVEIAMRKERLERRADAQRKALEESLQGLGGPAALVDRGLGVLHFAREHPVVVAAGVAGLLLASRRRGILPLAGSLLSGWRMWSAVSAWVDGRSA